jgi:hypothetical protein
MADLVLGWPHADRCRRFYIKEQMIRTLTINLIYFESISFFVVNNSKNTIIHQII